MKRPTKYAILLAAAAVIVFTVRVALVLVLGTGKWERTVELFLGVPIEVCFLDAVRCALNRTPEP